MIELIWNWIDSVCERENYKMSTTSSTSTQQSSGSEKTPDTNTPRTKKTHLKSLNSPTLRAFESFNDALGQFFGHMSNTIR